MDGSSDGQPLEKEELVLPEGLQQPRQQEAGLAHEEAEDGHAGYSSRQDHGPEAHQGSEDRDVRRELLPPQP